jgi:hypothetical protein
MTAPAPAFETRPARPALAVRAGVAIAVAVILSGAVILAYDRGAALLLDLASGMGGLFCF